MDAVTYPHADVRAELATHWVDAHLDVTATQAVANAFGVAGIPTAVAASHDARVLGRIRGFLPPSTFAAALGDLRTKR